MPPGTPSRIRASHAEREATLAVLQQAFVHGRIGPDELSVRQDVTLRSRYLDELGPLILDLPEAREFRSRVALASARTWRPQPSPAVRVDAAINHRAGMSWSLLTSRSYDLVPGQTLVRNVAWWGGDVMDLHHVMGPGVVVVLELHAVMGGHTIHVPGGVRVLDESNRLLMSTNDIAPAAQGDGSNGTLVLRGTQILSGSAVKLGARPTR